ncbi:MAG: helix-hairpin-helix domain-containing protein [Acidobacteria bacterium]|nr:helix-hairpin-helix domain-containing protein [Acidobacteriota bacterium]
MRNPFNRLCVLLLALSVVVPTWTATTDARDAQDAKPSGVALINLNTATVEQLDRLPGVGPKTAALIIEYRQKNGGFKKVEDLMNVRGIGEKSFLKLRPHITVTPVRIDRSGSDK